MRKVFNGTLAGLLASASLANGDSVYVQTAVSTGVNITSYKTVSIQPDSGYSPKIDGNIRLFADGMVIRDMEIYDASFITRMTALPGAEDIVSEDAVRAGGLGVKVINCVIHDSLEGIKVPEGYNSVELYGNLIYYNGWLGPDRGHGHGIYSSAVNLVLRNNVLYGGFSYNIHHYGFGDHGTLDNAVIEDNTSFYAGVLGTNPNSNILTGGEDGNVCHNPAWRRNMTWHPVSSTIPNNVGYHAGADGVILEDNYFPDGIDKSTASVVTETGNQYTPDASGKKVFVKQNAYQDTRVNITIYNWDVSNTVTVNLSGITGLASGDTVKVHNCQDYFVDIQTLVLNGSKQITVNMQAANRTVQTPQGWAAPATTFPLFGAFIAIKA
jgi:hypothetical protein